MHRKDFFLCHASSDKAAIVEPLAREMRDRGLSLWLDSREIAWGDDLVGRINEGLSQAAFVVVIVSEEFMRRPWARQELSSSLARELSGKTTVLPILVAEADKVFAQFPFMASKLYLEWSRGADAIADEMVKLVARGLAPLREAAGSLLSLPRLDGLAIHTLAYGEGPQSVSHAGADLMTLPAATPIPHRLVPFEGRDAFMTRELLPPDWRDVWGDRLFVPHEVTVAGVRPDPALTVGLYRITDQIYLEGSDASASERFTIRSRQGRGGVSAFVHANGEPQRLNPFNVDEELGAARLLVAVAFEGATPVGRSDSVMAIRKGIRHPNDLWRSTITGRPIVPPGTTDFRSARCLFQSPQPNGMSADLFVSDFSGRRLCNLTAKTETRYDGLFDDDGREVGRWLDGRRIEYCSMRDGSRWLVQRDDCLHGAPEATESL